MTYYNAKPGEIIPGAQTLWVPVEPQPLPDHESDFLGLRLKWQHPDGDWCGGWTVEDIAARCPYLPGSVLAVREDWRLDDADERLALKEYEGGMNPDWIFYPDPVHLAACFIDWRRSDTMPDWAIRHHFPIASVTAKRLSEATDTDGLHAGFDGIVESGEPYCWLETRLSGFHPGVAWYFVLTKETP